MHVDFLTVDGVKMSKSLNNLYTLDDLEEKGFEPLVYRMFNLNSNYGSKLNFTWEAMESAKTALERLRDSYKKHSMGTDDISDETINEYENKFHEAINDNLNMPVAMSIVWEVAKKPIKSKRLADLLLKFDTVLGLELDKEEQVHEIPKEIIKLAEQRKKARDNKDWAESDRIRNEINLKGYSIIDTPQGYEIEVGK